MCVTSLNQKMQGEYPHHLAGVTELDFITKLIHQEILHTDAANRRIVICGDGIDIVTMVDHLLVNSPSQEFVKYLIVATAEVDMVYLKYRNYPLRLVDWNEAAFEEELIDRVKPNRGRDRFKIHLLIDFQPTCRRLDRTRMLLEADGTLVIPWERSRWRDRYPALMNHFTENPNASFVKLIETLPMAYKQFKHRFSIVPTPDRAKEPICRLPCHFIPETSTDYPDDQRYTT